jgi:hypothetical protein
MTMASNMKSVPLLTFYIAGGRSRLNDYAQSRMAAVGLNFDKES